MSFVPPSLFPALTPSQLNQAWFPEIDQLSDETVISKAEEMYEAWRDLYANQGDGYLPYGKVGEEASTDQREETSASDNTSDDDVDTDVLDDQESLHDADIEMTPVNNNVSPVL
ncbi:anaphase-promoting complex subunit 15-like [Watersipora subatra]|uniref:anaphase-promoting complex subunit 15-like n=1 Tax=Watersipora subatra TaxID=2589382 RepID=UPI00355B9FAB